VYSPVLVKVAKHPLKRSAGANTAIFLIFIIFLVYFA
jgi:hypothetical protein